jgi:hypothetical protein
VQRNRRSVSRLNPIVAARLVAESIVDAITEVPTSREVQCDLPQGRARVIAKSAAADAGWLAGTLALPPGLLGWVTILPDLVGIWKIQAQMVADIAAVHGKLGTLTKEQMLFCLFRHSAAQLVRDLVVRVGDRLVVRRATLRLIQKIAQQIGIKLTQRVIGRAISRFILIAGAVGVGLYARYDTRKVSETAIELFSNPIEVVGPGERAS